MTATIIHRLPVDGQAWLKCHIEGTSEPVDLPNDAQKHPNWCCRFPDMCACNCSGRKSNAGARLAITVLESVGRILPTLLLSLARK